MIDPIELEEFLSKKKITVLKPSDGTGGHYKPAAQKKLEKLQALKDSDIISEDQYQKEKEKLLRQRTVQIKKHFRKWENK